tara:strand:- start:2477 stop:3784 length:1308 start_codon:yes stop_codon:yes gene_type:complete
MKKFINDIKQKKNWFCPLLFSHIYSNSDGCWSACCLSRPPSDLNTDNTSIMDWWNSDILNGLRNEMLNIDHNSEKIDHHCFKCKNEEMNGSVSARQKWLNNFLSSNNTSKTEEILFQINDYIDNKKMNTTFLNHYGERFLDLKLRLFGNLCNLSCYMCWPLNSTTRINDINKMDIKYKNRFKTFVNKKLDYPKHYVPKKENFTKTLKEIEKIAPVINSIKITGGEPMIMDSHYELLDLLIKTDNAKHINLKYQTNFTKFSRGEKAFFYYLKKFKNVSLHISVDSINEYDNYIRKNGNANVVETNIKKMKEFKNVSLGVHNTVSMLSIIQHTEFHNKWIEEYNIQPSYYILRGPNELRARNLPDEIKNEIISKIYASKYKDLYYLGERKNIINELKSKRSEEEFKWAIRYCLDLDKLYRRNNGLFQLWPELKKYYV